MESGAGRLDGLGAEAREAVGVQSPLAGGDGHQLRRRQRGDRAGNAGPVRDHARRRHAPASRVGPAAGRDDGAPARAGAVRCAVGPGRRGAWRLAAEGQLPPDGGDALAIRGDSGLVGGDRPVLDGGFRHLHGPVRPGQLHGQGDLRRRRLRGGQRSHVPGESGPQPRPDRGELRALRAGDGHRALRRLPAAIPRLRPPRASLGARRLAALAVAGPARADARRPAAEPLADAGALEGRRQPAAQPRPAGGRRAAGFRMDRPAGLAVDVDGPGPGGPGLAADPALPGDGAGGLAERVAGGLPGLARQRPAHGRAGGDVGDLPRGPGPDARRCDRADALSARRLAQAHAGVGDRRHDRAAPGDGALPILADDVARPGPGDRPGGAGGLGSPAIALGGGAVPAGLVPVAPGRLLGEQAEAPRRVAVVGRGARGVGARGPQDVALLRDVRRRRGPLAPPRQLPGGARRPRRPPDVPHEPGAPAPLDPGGARPRLPRPPLDGRPPGEDVRHPGETGAAPGALPQLVPDADPPALAADVCLDRRQRQLARLPRRVEARVEGEGRGADPGPVGPPGAGRHAGRPGRGPGRDEDAGRGRGPSRAGGGRPRPAHAPRRAAGRLAGVGRMAREDGLGHRRRDRPHPRAGGQGRPHGDARSLGQAPAGAGPRSPRRTRRDRALARAVEVGGAGGGGGPRGARVADDVGRDRVEGPRRPGRTGPARGGRPDARRPGRRRPRPVRAGPASALPPAGRPRRGPGRRDGLPLPLQGRSPPLRHRLQPRAGPARWRLLRPARLRIVPDQLPDDREGRGPPPALVPARQAVHQGRRQGRAALVGRDDVRVPDAAIAAEGAARHARGRGRRGGRRPAGRVRQAGGRPLGRLRVGLLVAICRWGLPVPVLRRPRPGPEARAGARPGGGPLRHDAGRHGPPPRRLGELPQAGERGGRGPLRVLRGHRLHPGPGAEGVEVGRRALVHGPSSGDGPGGDRQRLARRADAPAIRGGGDGPRGRAAAARARPPRDRAHRALGGRGRPRRDRPAKARRS